MRGFAATPAFASGHCCIHGKQGMQSCHLRHAAWRMPAWNVALAHASPAAALALTGGDSTARPVRRSESCTRSASFPVIAAAFAPHQLRVRAVLRPAQMPVMASGNPWLQPPRACGHVTRRTEAPVLSHFKTSREVSRWTRRGKYGAGLKGGGWNVFWKNDKGLKRLGIIFQSGWFYPAKPHSARPFPSDFSGLALM
jgi:hypothetical protein